MPPSVSCNDHALLCMLCCRLCNLQGVPPQLVTLDLLSAAHVGSKPASAGWLVHVASITRWGLDTDACGMQVSPHGLKASTGWPARDRTRT